MVDVLTYKATKVYTPQTNEWAEKAAMAKDIGRAASGILKSAGKIVEGAEKQEKAGAEQTAKMNAEIEKQNKALMKEKASAYDKMLDAQADDLAQRFQIELARQTRVINQQFELNPLDPEKENQTRAVAKDLQAQWLEKIPQESRERFIAKTNSKTNEYILSDVKNSIQKQIKDSSNMMADNVKFAVQDAERLASIGDFDAIQKNFIESSSELENYISGMMSPEEQAIAKRQFDRNYLSSIIKGVAQNNPQLAKEFKDNPAALSAILSGGDYVGELAARSELNKGMEEIAGMEFPKNTRYQREKEQAKLVNSLGLVEIDFDDGSQKGLTLASSNANPKLTRYTAELLGGGTGKDLDIAIKQAENVQKAKLDEARYNGAIQSIFTASYQNLEQIKNSDLYKKGDEYTVGFANRYEKMLNDRREAMDNAVKMTDEELYKTIDKFNKSLEKIDGKNVTPIIDAYTELSKIQAAISVNPKLSRLAQFKEAIDIVPVVGQVMGDITHMSESLQKTFEDAVMNQDFRSKLTRTISKHWNPRILPTWFSIKPGEKTETSRQELDTQRAEMEAVMGAVELFGQGRADEGAKYYFDKRNAYYDKVYSDIMDMEAVYSAWKEGKAATVPIYGALYSCPVERDTDGEILFKPLMTKVAF